MMPFTANINTKKIKIESNETSEQEKISFLEPSKNSLKDSYGDPYKHELIEKNAFQYTMKTLNALKIVSPIIECLMQKPGVDAKNEDLAQTFKQLIANLSSVSEQICEKLNVDPTKEKNFWIKNSIEKNLSVALKESFLINKELHIEALLPLIDTIITTSETVQEKNKNQTISGEHFLSFSCIKAMIPIIAQMKINSLYRNTENDIEHIMDKLFCVSQQAVERLANDYATEKERSKLFFMFMQEASNLYATSWKMEGIRIQNIIDHNPSEKIQSSFEKYKSNGGFPLTKIEHDFDRYFQKMVTVTAKLIVYKKSRSKNQ